ncbi:MAG: type II toxin-antitoxin system RelE/ParE family toxin [Sphingomonadales bacterium]
MFTVLRSDVFDQWLKGLKDKRGVVRIVARVRALEAGHFGDMRPVGGGVSELRIHHGPGYRLYFMRRGQQVYLLLLAGRKASQKRDIARALDMARSLSEE